MGDVLDLSGDGGVLKTTIRKAKTDAIGPTKDLPIVDVHYELSFADTGDVFYDTREDEIQSFETYSDEAIEGLDIALRTMKVGEIASIRCEPNYAYGSAGSPPEIPPNTALVFEVELMACGPRRSPTPDSPSIGIEMLEDLRKWTKAMAAAAEREEKEKEMREAEVEGVEYCLTADGGVKKEITRKAKSDAIGPTGDLRIVVVHHLSGVAVKETGETCIFDEGPILTFEIGMDFVTRGWDIALRSMKVGDIARITCKPEYAYGEEGSPPVVPPNATLICELELMACHSWRSAIPGVPSEEEERLECEREWEFQFKKWEDLSVDELFEQWGKAARVRDAKKNQRRKAKGKAG